MKKYSVVIVIFIIIIIVAIVAYRQKWFNNKPTDAQLYRLIDTAAATGADTFEGVSFAHIKELMQKNCTYNEVERMIFLFSIKESDMTSAQKAEIKYLLEKALGKPLQY
jgi:hypothetical protein